MKRLLGATWLTCTAPAVSIRCLLLFELLLGANVQTGVAASAAAGSGWQVLLPAGSGPAFYHPTAVGVDEKGHVYVLDAGNYRIVNLSPSGRETASWHILAPAGGRYAEPVRMTVDPSGNVYVPELGCLRKYSSTGRALGCVSRTYGTDGVPVAVGGRGNIFVPGGSGLVKLSPAGAVVARWRIEGAGGTTAPTGRTAGGTATPIGLTIDRRGNVYAIVYWRGDGPVCSGVGCGWAYSFRVDKYSPAGRQLATWLLASNVPGAASQVTYAQLQNGSALSVDGSGAVYLATGEELLTFSSTGRLLKTWHTAPIAAGVWRGQLKVPLGVAVGPRDNVFVTDWGDNRVQKMAPDGRTLEEWGATAGGTEPGKLFFPYGLAISSDGGLYVADHGNNRIAKLSLRGLWHGSWQLPAAQQNLTEIPDPIIAWRFNSVTPDLTEYLVGLAAGAGTVLTTRPGNSYGAHGRGALLTYSSGGALLRLWKDPRWVHDGVEGPYGVAVDGLGAIYLTDYESITKLSSRYTVQWRQSSYLNSALAVDGQNNLYVATTSSPLLRKVSRSGQVLASWGIRAAAIAIDRRGHIYVADAAQSRILRLSKEGRVMAQWGGPGSEPGKFHHPCGIAVDASGNVYVADTGNNRIQKLPIK